MDAGNIQASPVIPKSIGPANRPQADESKESGPIDLAKIAQPILGVGNSLKAGEKMTISLDGDKVIISKEGPDTWDKIKVATADTMRGAFRLARGVVEQDPSFAFREALEVAKNSVSRILPDPSSNAINVGLYPVMRSVLTAIDLHKAVKTTREPGTNLADKLIDYGHVATDLGGLLAIGGNIIAPIARAIPWVGYLAGAAIIGDIVAGAWHALRFASQGMARLNLNESDAEGQKPQDKPPQVKLEITAPQDGVKKT